MFFVCFILILFLFQYNKFNTIIEHVSTPVPTVDNIYKYIYTCTGYAYIIDEKVHPYRQRVGLSTS